jgi:hypothetical protein
MAKVGRPVTARHKERVALLSDWHATPEPLREDVLGAKNLKELAVKNGELPNQNWYKLADSAEVYHDTLVKVAGAALDKVPAVLEKLSDQAMEGQVRASEVLLEFIRKTITDEGFLSKLKPVTDVSEIFNRVASTADKLTELADRLGSDPVVAAAKWKEMKDGAIEAEFTEEPTCPTTTTNAESAEKPPRNCTP